tara:strand:+ start:2234 stop:2422 length:189 start_codon:yes stop_codon:yes gene_type:complete
MLGKIGNFGIKIKKMKMKIKDIEKWTDDDYYPKKEKIKRIKPRKKDLDYADESRMINKNNKK